MRVRQERFKRECSFDIRSETKIVSTQNKLRELVLKKTPKKKKIDIIQTGGFLGALITPILSILGGLLGSNGSS